MDGLCAAAVAMMTCHAAAVASSEVVLPRNVPVASPANVLTNALDSYYPGGAVSARLCASARARGDGP